MPTNHKKTKGERRVKLEIDYLSQSAMTDNRTKTQDVWIGRVGFKLPNSKKK